MKAAVITYPGSNCDRDLAVAFAQAGAEVTHVWHKDTDLPAGTDIVGIPGGFSFGDYLRCGAIAARAPIARAVSDFAGRGGHVLGICNGFQVLLEMGLLPGALLRNAHLKYTCKTVGLRVASDASPFTAAYGLGADIRIPVAHHDGNYTATPDTLAHLRDTGRVAFRYIDNPNGSADDIAGILSENGRVLGMMPHPERALSALQGSSDGRTLFDGLMSAFAPA
jgi:phosphoribosylformylglycinamidine synthase I